MSKAHAEARRAPPVVRPVSHPHDPAEREAHRAADVVARGGTVAGWSFSSVPTSAPVHRQETGTKPKSEEDKYKEVPGKVGEAFLETKTGKELKEKVLAHPDVRAVKDAITSPAGLAVTGTVVAGGVAALAATGKELPVQPPEIPLDLITPGLSAKVTYQGPVNAPTFVGLSITYKEQGPKAKGPKQTDTDRLRAENARLAADQDAFRRNLRYAPGSKEAEDQRLTDEAIASVVAKHSGLIIPLTPAPKKQDEAPKQQDAAPVQREPASTSVTAVAPADVDAGLASRARPLDPATRRSMEAGFGFDFSRVRVHDDERAASTAAAIDAAAFTVGEDVVFGGGRHDPASATGRHLLAHELAHVVQQSARGTKLQRKAEPAISAPYDSAEREADEVADRVVAGLPAGGPTTTSRGAGPSFAPPGFADALAATRQSGERIPTAPRRTLEGSFGTSFAHVRLHRDDASDRLAASIGAEAFTAGSHIHVSSRAPGAATRAGLRLLAHELTHVGQHAGGDATTGTVHRTRALYMSTFGKEGFFRGAKGYHKQQGFPPPVEVSSIEEMLEHMVTLPRPLESVRVVTHALPIGIFLPLLRGGSGSLFAHDLTLQTQSRLEAELADETATQKVGRGDTPTSFREQQASHHVVDRVLVSTAFTRLRNDADTKKFLQARHFPEQLATGGDLETLMWWVLDRELVGAQREQTVRGGRKRMVPVVPGMTAPRRAAAVASLDRNVAIYRDRVRDHLLLRPPSTPGNAEHRRADAIAGVTEFEQRLVRVAAKLIDEEADRGISVQVAQPTAKYGTVQGALERGTFPNNVLAAKVAIPNGMPLEIRGCNIGKNVPWLEAFRDFWGLGAGESKKRPDVSAPDVPDEFGIRGQTFVEFLHGPKGRRILAGTPEFDQHIVHAR